MISLRRDWTVLRKLALLLARWVGLVLTLVCPTDTVHPGNPHYFLFFVSCAGHIMGMQKYMFVDLFLHGAMVSRVSAVGQAQWEAWADWGFSTPLLVSSVKGDL